MAHTHGARPRYIPLEALRRPQAWYQLPRESASSTTCRRFRRLGAVVSPKSLLWQWSSLFLR